MDHHICVKVSAKAKYRSKLVVNMDYDMVRVVLDMTIHEWVELKRRILENGVIKEKEK